MWAAGGRPNERRRNGVFAGCQRRLTATTSAIMPTTSTTVGWFSAIAASRTPIANAVIIIAPPAVAKVPYRGTFQC